MQNNIVLVCYKYPPEYSGYGKQLKSVLSKILKKNDRLNFTLLTSHESSQKENKKNLKIVSFNKNKNSNSGITFYIFVFKLFFWLLFNSKQYSTIHCIKAGPEAIISNIVGKILRKKVIVKIAQDELSSRELENVNKLKWIIRKIRHWLLSSVDHFIAISTEIEGNISDIKSKKSVIHKIPNGVDVDKFYPLNEKEKKIIREKMDLPIDQKIILYAGAINTRKGIKDLLEAINHVEDDIRCTFVLCGPILEDIDFENKIENINFYKSNINITYRGAVNNVSEYMQASDIFILPSYSEGLPNVLLEASSSGLALIGTKIGGNTDIVEHGQNGFLVNVGSPEDLSKKINYLLKNDQLTRKMGKESREVAITYFDLCYIANRYVHIYTI